MCIDGRPKTPYKSDRRIGSKSALPVVMVGIVMKFAIEMV
jgi:hypothetical protein